jgi:hypothetical protein
VGRCQGDAHLLFQVADGTQGDGHAQDGLDELLDASPTGVQDAAEKRQRCRQASTADVSADVVGDLGPSDRTAVQTSTSVRLILGHLHRDGRQLDGLMPTWGWVVSRGLLGQIVVAGLAALRQVMDNRLGKAIGRQSDPQTRVMSRLTAGLAAGGFLLNGSRSLRWVSRGRDRGVGGILSASCFKLTESCLELGDSLAPFTASRAGRLVHAAMLWPRASDSCASF